MCCIWAGCCSTVSSPSQPERLRHPLSSSQSRPLSKPGVYEHCSLHLKAWSGPSAKSICGRRIQFPPESPSSSSCPAIWMLQFHPEIFFFHSFQLTSWSHPFRWFHPVPWIHRLHWCRPLAQCGSSAPPQACLPPARLRLSPWLHLQSPSSAFPRLHCGPSALGLLRAPSSLRINLGRSLLTFHHGLPSLGLCLDLPPLQFHWAPPFLWFPHCPHFCIIFETKILDSPCSLCHINIFVCCMYS